jgi:flagellar motor protein MotB
MSRISFRQGVFGSSLVSWGVAVATLGLSSGCVSYQQYRQLEEQYDNVKTANGDLTKKYNQAIQQLMAEKNGQPAPSGDNAALLKQINQLTDDLAKARLNPGFTKEQIRSIAGAKDEEGAMALGEALLFNEGSADLKREAFPILDGVVGLLKREYPSELVIIEGHTDNQPVVKVKMRYPDNEALAHARARAVRAFFLDKGIPEARMIVHSYSFTKPIDPGTADTKEGRKENRRVVVRRGGAQI